MKVTNLYRDGSCGARNPEKGDYLHRAKSRQVAEKKKLMNNRCGLKLMSHWKQSSFTKCCYREFSANLQRR